MTENNGRSKKRIFFEKKKKETCEIGFNLATLMRNTERNKKRKSLNNVGSGALDINGRTNVELDHELGEL